MTTYRQITEPELIALLVEDVFELSGALRRVGHIIARAEGQTHARWQLLNAALGGDKTVSQIARRLGLARQGVQRVADILVSEGLALYKSNPDHKRAPLVEASRQGKRVLKRLTKKSRRFRELVGKKTTKRSLANLRGAILTLSEIVIRAEHDQRLFKP